MRYGGSKEREEGKKLCHNHGEKGLQNSTLGKGRDRVRTIVERTDDGSRGGGDTTTTLGLAIVSHFIHPLFGLATSHNPQNESSIALRKGTTRGPSIPAYDNNILVLQTKRNRRIAIKYEIKSCFVIELCSHNPLLQLYGAPIHKWGKKIERAADVDIGKIGVDKKRRPFGARRRREVEGTEGGEDGAWERERSRALCTSHLGDEKNETAAEGEGEGRGGKATEWCSFQNKFPRVGRGAEKEGEREGRGALPTNVVFAFLEL